MAKVYIVQGEHPFDPYFPLFAHSDPKLAELRAVELVNGFLKDFWPIFNDQETQPVADLSNWEDLVEELGHHDEFVQNDGWGSWFVQILPTQVDEPLNSTH